MRHHLARDFDAIYVLDLGGDVRKNEKLSGTTHNVFGIQVGVSINLLVRHGAPKNRVAAIRYSRVDEWWRREQKYKFLETKADVQGIDWASIIPDTKSDWFTEGLKPEFDQFSAIGKREDQPGLFELYSPGINTARDPIAYNFSPDTLAETVDDFLEKYNGEVSRYTRNSRPKDLEAFLRDDVNLSRNLKRHLSNCREFNYNQELIRQALYRPYTTNHLYCDLGVVDELGKSKQYLPAARAKNYIMCVLAAGSVKPFHCIATDLLPDFHLAGDTQCFPFYTYDEDGSNRRENIADWALEEFRKHYADASITKWDIFHYTYALLHSPEYRERYAANLKRELPRIPYAPEFRAFVTAGQRLADLHVNYEKQPEYPLQQMWKPDSKLDMRVEKMRLGKDRTSLIYNDSLILSGIPPEAFEYRLGNRSALEWVIDQYQVSMDKRSGIVNDPNREDDPEYILRLIGQVIYVSLDTVQIVKALPSLGVGAADEASAK